jgi:uncharacterized SAM-binding protein YcdF (DUF218 family)
VTVERGFALVVPGNGRFDRAGGYGLSAACRRVVAEAERLAARLAPEIVVLSGWSPVEGASEAEQMRTLWREPNVELVLETTATTTAENAVRTVTLLRERGIMQAIVVCTPLHLYRARWFFGRVYRAHGIDVSFRVARVLPTPAALAWELGALTVRARQLKAAESELERSS